MSADCLQFLASQHTHAHTQTHTGTFILKGGPVEEAQILLDDHVVKSQVSVVFEWMCTGIHCFETLVLQHQAHM